MSKEVSFRYKKRKLRKKRMHRFIKTVSLLLFIALIISAAYGLLGHFGVLDGHSTNPHMTVQESSNQDSPGTTAGTDDGKTSWYLILVNKWNPIPNNYTVNLTKLSNGQNVDTRIYPALQKMFDAARKDGIYPVVAAGYRTAAKQKSLMDEKIAELEAGGSSAAEAKKAAETWVAVPGTSEHQLGIAVDINADGIHSAGSAVYDWLNKNAWKYGFILRYPSDKTAVTGTSYEPWHYRYVGETAAEQMYRQGLCLEEYLKTLK